VRELNPDATLCCYGLYAPLNQEVLSRLGVEAILGGEFEADLLALATGQSVVGISTEHELPRLSFLVPDRSDLPPPSHYAALEYGSEKKIVGYTEASRGCKHHCKHCPIVPIYKGQFRVIPVEVVIEDVRRQVDRGVQHITFGDPDFFNGIGHALRVIESIADNFPDLTYDVTIKIEHLLQHSDQLIRLRDTRCLFVTSAVESFDDEVLSALNKGHTAADVRMAVKACRECGINLIPTFVAFTPWTTLESYVAFLHTIDELSLVHHVAPIQLAIRLLVPDGSYLLTAPEVNACLKPFDPSRLVHPWQHPDPKVDALHEEIAALVGRSPLSCRAEIFDDVWQVARRLVGRGGPVVQPTSRKRSEVPFLNEPWYC
jgi:radical SAM superfamily enzyme YgiQ (UPF0313 family)